MHDSFILADILTVFYRINLNLKKALILLRFYLINYSFGRYISVVNFQRKQKKIKTAGKLILAYLL